MGEGKIIASFLRVTKGRGKGSNADLLGKKGGGKKKAKTLFSCAGERGKRGGGETRSIPVLDLKIGGAMLMSS